MAPGLAVAQTAPSVRSGPAPDVLDEVVVTGQRLANVRAIEAKRADDRIVDAVSADEIGALPDFGFGEALQRVPGVSLLMNNQRGEAQFVTVRGLNSDYTLVERDGVALPATEQGRRNVSLDVLPSTIASRITVTKTLTPDMDANAIGGLVEYRTPSAFDHRGVAASLRGDVGAYDNSPRQSSSGPSGRLDGLFSTRFGPGDHFGFLASGSYFRRVSSSLDGSVSNYAYYTPQGTTVPANSPAAADAIAAPLRREWYSYDNTRERVGVFSKLEYDDGILKAHLSGAYFRHQNDEYRNQNLMVSSGALQDVTPTGGRALSGTGQVAFNNFVQNRTIAYVDLGGERRFGAHDVVKLNANYGEGTYKQDNLQNVYTSGGASPDFAYTYRFSPGDFPVFTPVNPSVAFSPSRYRQTQYGTGVDENVEKVLTLSADWAHNLDADSIGWGFKLGAKARQLDRRFDRLQAFYQPRVAANAPTLAAAFDGANGFSPYNDPAAPYLLVDPAAAQRYFESHMGDYTAEANNANNSLASDYTLTEDIYAGYAMAAYRAERWSLTGGLRYEETKLTTGSPTRPNEPGAPAYVWQSRESRYGRLLPSANLSYDLTDRLRLRAAFSQALGRPSYNEIGLPIVVNQRGLTISITQGNPDLKPREADNYDLSLEWYVSRDTLLSAAVFHKNIRNEIFRATSGRIVNVAGEDVEATVTQPENLDKSAISGLELNFIKSRFEFLPGPLAGLGVSANVTLLTTDNTSIRMNDGSLRELRGLVEQADTTGNVSLLYELGRFRAQLAYNYTGRMLWTVATDAGPNDRSIGPVNVFDLQASYRLRTNLTLVGQAKNLTNNRPTRLQGPNQELLKDELDNGRAYFVGFSWRY